MLRSKELRIGNYVHFKELNDRDSSYSVIHELSEQMIDLGNDYQVRPIGIKPIPLTEEWLLKFGLHSKHNYFKSLGVHLEGGLCVCYFADNEYGHSKEDEIVLKYVHQLQNLYFALTGEELQIKD
jgi:hypothetical protein